MGSKTMINQIGGRFIRTNGYSEEACNWLAGAHGLPPTLWPEEESRRGTVIKMKKMKRRLESKEG